MRISRKLAVATTALAVALSITACSADTEAPADTATTAELSAEAQAALETAYAGVGATSTDIESATPKADVKFYVMSCGESNATCTAPAHEMLNAAEAAGWDANLVDGKLSPEGFATAIRQAVAAGADVLVPVGISCSTAAAAFQEAKDAGVTIIGGGGLDDCSPQLWASERLWLEDSPAGDMFSTFGYLQANYAVGKTDGNVKAIVINQTSNAWGSLLTSGFTDELTALDGGEVLDVIDVSDPEAADNSYIQKVTSALLANPDVNVLSVPTDSYLVNGLAAAIDQAGRGDDLIVIGNFGTEAALDMIRSGQPGITAVIGQAQLWEAWGSVDTAIRILDGQDALYTGVSMQAVDADTNMPESGPYNGSIDWKNMYLKAWGK